MPRDSQIWHPGYPICPLSMFITIRCPRDTNEFAHLHQSSQGLLDMAFDPNFSTNNFFYLSHSVALGQTNTEGTVSSFVS